MPHLTLEHSSNITLPDDHRSVLLDLHRALNEIGGIAIGNCKSRIYRADSFAIGDESAQRDGFVHLDIIFVAGRSEETKAQISRACLEILKTAFLPGANCPLQITVNVGDIPIEVYSKYPEGTLSYQ